MTSFQSINFGQGGLTSEIDTIEIKDHLYESDILSPEIGSNKVIRSLRSEGNLFIRNYGPGSIATLSMRGGSSQQSLMLWQDIPITHPMLGLTDISLLPGFSQKVEVVNGGGSTLWGNGAIGGVVNLGSPHSETNSTEMEVVAGSFSTITSAFDTRYAKKKWSGASRGSIFHSSNNFSFQPFEGASRVDQVNAGFTQGHFQQDITYTPSPNQRLSFHSWLYRGQRQIPPTLTQLRSEASQLDYGARFVTKYEQSGKDYNMKFNVAYFRDGILYQDPGILQESESLGESVNASASVSKAVGRHLFYTSVSGQWLRGRIDAYNGVRDEWRHHLNAFYQVDLNLVKIKTGLAGSFRIDQWTPLLPEASLIIPFQNNSSMQLSLARHFRFPTLNDLYWAPGGNLNLLPEEGWSQDLTFNKKWDWNQTKISLSSSIYHRLINDFILWSLTEGASFWQASNATKVRTIGSEFSLEWKQALSGSLMVLEVMYQYNRSRYEEDVTVPRLEAGSRLLLTPDHLGVVKLGIEKENWVVEYEHEMTGSSRGINEDVDGFNIGHFRAGYRLGKNTRVHIAIRNMWDVSYVLTERRPMPGRYIEFGINIKK